MEVGALHPHLLEFPGGTPIPEGDQGGPLHCPPHPAAVGRLPHRADPVCIEHHRLMEQLRRPNDGQVVQQRPGGGPVLEQAPAAGQQGVAPPESLQHLPHLEAWDRLQTAQVPGQLRVIGQYSHRHVLAGGQDPLMDGLEDSVVSGVGEAVIAAHHHMVAAAAHLVVHRQAVLRHAAH